VSNENREPGTGRYATFWMGAATTGALILLWFFVFSSAMGYSN
jgi:hypothetical protein